MENIIVFLWENRWIVFFVFLFLVLIFSYFFQQSCDVFIDAEVTFFDGVICRCTFSYNGHEEKGYFDAEGINLAVGDIIECRLGDFCAEKKEWKLFPIGYIA